MSLYETFDKLDRKLLAALDVNARQSTSELARRLRHGRDLIDYRVRRLFDAHILSRTSAIVDPYRYGFTLYKMYCRLRGSTLQKEHLVRYLANHPHIFCFSRTDGIWDISFSLMARHVHQFEKLFNQIMTKFRGMIVASALTVVTRQQYFSKRSVDEGERVSWTIGEEAAQYPYDTLDIKILNLLVRDARISVVDIAKEAKTTAVVVKNRIEKLEDQKIIRGYRTELNRTTLNIVRYRIQVRFEHYTSAEIHRFATFCRQTSIVTRIVWQVGSYHAEITVECRDYREFSTFVDELRATFPDLIDLLDTFTVRDSAQRWIISEVSLPVEKDCASVS